VCVCEREREREREKDREREGGWGWVGVGVGRWVWVGVIGPGDAAPCLRVVQPVHCVASSGGDARTSKLVLRPQRLRLLRAHHSLIDIGRDATAIVDLSSTQMRKTKSSWHQESVSW
jgi:hypothetical protein